MAAVKALSTASPDGHSYISTTLSSDLMGTGEAGGVKRGIGFDSSGVSEPLPNNSSANWESTSLSLQQLDAAGFLVLPHLKNSKFDKTDESAFNKGRNRVGPNAVEWLLLFPGLEYCFPAESTSLPDFELSTFACSVGHDNLGTVRSLRFPVSSEKD